MIECDVLSRTANELMDYLASDGQGGNWIYFADLQDLESLYNLRGVQNFVGKLARNLASWKLAQTRREARGIQLRLTSAGIDLASERELEAARALAAIDWAHSLGEMAS